MKNRNTFCVFAFTLLLALLSSAAFAQPREHDRGKKRFEKFEREKLTEVMQLTPEQADRFFQEREKYRESRKICSDCIDMNMEEMCSRGKDLTLNDNDTAYSELLEKFFTLQREMVESRVAFFNTLETYLTHRQIIIYIIFEKRLRDEIYDMKHQERRQDPPPEGEDDPPKPRKDPPERKKDPPEQKPDPPRKQDQPEFKPEFPG